MNYEESITRLKEIASEIESMSLIECIQYEDEAKFNLEDKLIREG